ncbi:ankyrin repeat-containing domain protein [Peziza echinospora]|nr:ankyrin repeat-containing domain protein [Peziza echinospora]
MVVVEDLQRHKLSLDLMLTIIQCSTTAEATASLVQLQEAVRQVMETNHRISESNRRIELQLRELIAHRSQHQEAFSSTATLSFPDSGIDTFPSLSLNLDAQSLRSPLFKQSGQNNIHKRDGDNATIKTVSSYRSILSIRSLQTELDNSRVYRWAKARANRYHSDASSLYSVNSRKTGSWSMLSDISLVGLSISQISVIDLPISIHELWPWDLDRLAATPNDGIDYDLSAKLKRERGIKWSSGNRIHNAISTKNDYTVRTLLALGADPDEVDFDGRTPLEHLIHKFDLENHNFHFNSELKELEISRSLELCQFLIKKGAKVNWQKLGWNAITISLYLWHPSAQHLEATDNKGWTALAYAIAIPNTALKPNMDDTPISEPILVRWLNKAFKTDIDLCRKIIGRGATFPPLLDIASFVYWNEGLVELVLELGKPTELNVLDSAGLTALEFVFSESKNSPDRGIHELGRKILHAGVHHIPDLINELRPAEWNKDMFELIIECGQVCDKNEAIRCYINTSPEEWNKKAIELFFEYGHSSRDLDAALQYYIKQFRYNFATDTGLCRKWLENGVKFSYLSQIGLFRWSKGLFELIRDLGDIGDLEITDVANQTARQRVDTLLVIEPRNDSDLDPELSDDEFKKAGVNASTSIDLCKRFWRKGACFTDLLARSWGSSFSFEWDEELANFALLYGKPADLELVDLQGRTALEFAFYSGKRPLIEQLCESGASVAPLKETFVGTHDLNMELWTAAKNGESGYMQILLALGADSDHIHCPKFDSYNIYGEMTPLLLATLNGHQEASLILINSGANLSIRSKTQKSIFHMAAMNENGHQVLCHALKVQVDLVLDIDSRELRKGLTALHIATNKQHIENMRFFIRHGADPMIKSLNGSTAFDTAEEKGLRWVFDSWVFDSI